MIEKLINGRSLHKKSTNARNSFEDLDYQNYDLNKLETEELNKHKEYMDELYFKNYKDPKAKDFVYDIEVTAINITRKILIM